MQKLNDAQINEKLSKITGWERKGDFIQKEFQFADFRMALAMMVQIGIEAERMNHHPNWSNVYNRLNISLSTHDAGGLTQKDFDLANKIEEIVA